MKEGRSKKKTRGEGGRERLSRRGRKRGIKRTG